MRNEELLKDINFLMRCIWKTDKRIKDQARKGWVLAHIGKSLYQADLEELLILRFLLAFKAKTGQCPIEEHRDNSKLRRKKIVGSSRKSLKIKILERDGSKCRECSRVNNLTLDHVIPLSEGGLHEEENLQILCQICHEKKNKKDNKEPNKRFFKEMLPENIKLAKKYYYNYKSQASGKVTAGTI